MNRHAIPIAAAALGLSLTTGSTAWAGPQATLYRFSPRQTGPRRPATPSGRM